MQYHQMTPEEADYWSKTPGLKRNMQKILSIDSQILNTFQACARKCQLNFQQNVHPISKAEALEGGGLLHDMLEIYYSLQLEHFSFDTPNWRKIIEAGIDPPKGKSLNDYMLFAIKCGRFFSTKLELPADEIEEITTHFTAYCQHFSNDEWHPLAVEEVGSKIMFEDENLKLIYNFKIDLVAEKGRIVAPFDHKSSRRRSEPSSLANQFIGYCYGLGMNNIVINKIGFQKTLSPAQRFNRFILTIDDSRINEWVENTIFWARALVQSEESGIWPMNLTSCDKYSGCIYAPICETDPESRLYKIERDFKIGEQWDPAGTLEAK